jgi:hypothetical protein
MVHEYESCNNRHHDEGHSNCPVGAHFYSNDNKMWYTAIGLPYPKLRVDPVFFSDPMTAAMKALGIT